MTIQGDFTQAMIYELNHMDASELQKVFFGLESSVLVMFDALLDSEMDKRNLTLLGDEDEPTFV